MKINTLHNLLSTFLISRYLRSLTFLCAILFFGFNGFGQNPTVDIQGEPATVNTIAEYTVTVVFSEGVNGFDQSDVVVVNGSVTTFIPLSFSDYSVGITPSGAQGNITIDIPDDSATAILGGAGNTAAAQATTLFDNIQPSVVISSAVGSPTNTNPIPITITFSEAVTGFMLGDIGVTNGTAGNFGGTGTTYTADITPAADGTVTINVAAGVALDGAGNVNTAATPYSRVYDGTQPSVVISSAVGSPTNTNPIPITITFSEAVTGFVLGDIGVTNGTAGNFGGTGTTYTADITPAADGTVTINVAAGVASDGAGNVNTAATPYSRVYDGTGPSVVISSAVGSPTNTNPIPITITFSEAVTGFVLGDIGVTNGTAGNFGGTGTTYTADITPSADGTVTINVAAGVASDGAGNVNTAATPYSRLYDGTQPSVVISSAVGSPTNTNPIPITITFSEAVTGFVLGDIGVTNGTAGNFGGTGTTYTADITPGGNGTVTINVAAGVALDGAGNVNTAATPYSRVYDGTGPSVVISSAVGSPTNTNPIPITITFSEAVTGFVLGDIGVTNGTAGNFGGTGTTYTADITPGGNGTVTINVAAGVALDGIGNGNTAATPYSRVYDGTGPSVVISSAVGSPTNTNPILITITFSEAVTGFVLGDIGVTNGTAGNFGGTGTTYTADITPAADGTVTINVAAGVASDGAGNVNTAATPYSRVYDGTQPSVVISSAVGSPTNTNPIPITITFSEAVTGFVLGDIGVTNGTAGNFGGTGTTYTADITPAADGTVTINVAAGLALDGVGNGNTAATPYNRVYDNTPPVGYSANINQDPITTSNQTAVSFTFSGATVGTVYNYSFSSSEGGTNVTGTGTVTGAGQTISGINLSSLADGNITLSVTLTDDVGNIGNAATDNSTKITAGVTIDDVLVNEDDGTAIFTVTLNGTVLLGTFVSYETANNTAIAGSDYVADSGTLFFSGLNGQTRTITININDDTEAENTETFFVNLTNATGFALISKSQGIGTIADNDNCIEAPLINSTPTIFCDAFIQDLDAYTDTTIPAGFELIWSSNSDFSVTGARLNTSVIDFEATFYGFLYNESTGCVSPPLEVTLVRNEPPEILGTTPATICGTGMATISATVTAGGSLFWYASESGGTSLEEGSSFSTSVSGTTTYYVEAFANGCFSEREAVTITVNDLVDTGTITDTSACSIPGGGPTTVDLDDTRAGGTAGVWSIVGTPPSTITIGADNIVDFEGAADGDYVFRFTTNTAVSPCVDESVDVTISVTTCTMDSDGDGLFDRDETALGLDPTLRDTDADGIEDGVEVGPDVNNPVDTDGDGIIDALDSNILDSDNDGVVDQLDPANTNPCIPNISTACRIDLALEKTVDKESILVGREVIFTITLTNLSQIMVTNIAVMIL